MDWEGKVRVLASDASDRTLAAAFGGPLVADELAFRASVEQRSFDGYIWNATRQACDDALHALTYRGKLLWTPSAIEGLKVQLGYTKAHRTGPYLYVTARRWTACSVCIGPSTTRRTMWSTGSTGIPRSPPSPASSAVPVFRPPTPRRPRPRTARRCR